MHESTGSTLPTLSVATFSAKWMHAELHKLAHIAMDSSVFFSSSRRPTANERSGRSEMWLKLENARWFGLLKPPSSRLTALFSGDALFRDIRPRPLDGGEPGATVPELDDEGFGLQARRGLARGVGCRGSVHRGVKLDAPRAHDGSLW